MEESLLYMDQKSYHFLDKRFDAIKQVAVRSRRRSITWGTIAALAWIGYATTMPPIQRGRSIWPHVGMLVLASAIAGTTRNFHRTACQVEKSVDKLKDELKQCRHHDDVVRVMEKDDEFEKEYHRFALMADEVQDRIYG